MDNIGRNEKIGHFAKDNHAQRKFGNFVYSIIVYQ